MYHSKSLAQAKTLLLLSLLVISASGCSSFAARNSRSRGPDDLNVRFSGKGLRIMKVNQGGAAEQAGLKPMDIIFRYGDFELVDDASYFAARDAYEQRRDSQVSLAVWRGDKALKMMVATGKLGIESNEYNPVTDQFRSLMYEFDGQREIPEYQRDHEFKDSLTPPEKILAEAKQLIDKAEQEGTLTPTQVLVARIYMIPDDASPEDLKRQSEMTAQFIATQPLSYVANLGQDDLFEMKHYRPAVECLKRYLETNPDDVSIRLNLGTAYYRLRMFAEAEAAADYVIDNQLGLAPHGQGVTGFVKAIGVLGRGDYAGSMFFAQKSFDVEPHYSAIALVMLAAAELGDLQKLEAASRKFQRELPQEFAKRKLALAAVEAPRPGQEQPTSRARALVQEWKDTDRIEGRLKTSGKSTCGADVWNNWNELTRN